MKFFRTEDAVSFHYGAILGLTDKQAVPRIQIKNLKALGDGRFEVTGDVQFKMGEIIGLEEKDIPKGLAGKFSLIEKEETLAPAGGQDIPFGDVPSAKKFGRKK